MTMDDLRSAGFTEADLDELADAMREPTGYGSLSLDAVLLSLVREGLHARDQRKATECVEAE